ncbi:MAG: hypothetical protein V3V40_06070 [Nitrosomonadaceae bacterium]
MIDTPDRSEQFQCAMCKGVFAYDWSEEEALAEAKRNGVNVFESATVCDECYEKTPWGEPVMTVCAIKDCDEKAVKCDLCTLHFELRLQNKQSEVKVKREK